MLGLCPWRRQAGWGGGQALARPDSQEPDSNSRVTNRDLTTDFHSQMGGTPQSDCSTSVSLWGHSVCREHTLVDTPQAGFLCSPPFPDFGAREAPGSRWGGWAPSPGRKGWSRSAVQVSGAGLGLQGWAH